MVRSSHQQSGSTTKDILAMQAIAVSLLQHGMHYDWHWHSYANDFGNTHPSLKQPSKLLAVCQRTIQPMVMCFCVPEGWLVRRSLQHAPTVAHTHTQSCLRVWARAWKWPPLKAHLARHRTAILRRVSHREIYFIFWDLNARGGCELVRYEVLQVTQALVRTSSVK